METSPSVSIVIVNWRTYKQTKLCLRSIRKYTHYPHVEVVVVENDGQDETAAYLRGLPWIRYIENKHPQAHHRNGMQLGVQETSSDYVLMMHTDAFVHAHHWLTRLMEQVQDNTALLGSQDRLLRPTPWYRIGDDYFRRAHLERRWRRRGLTPKILSHCALYRRDLFTEHHQRFDYPEMIDGVRNDAGEFIQRYCEENGLGVIYLRRKFMASLLWHFEAATLNVLREKRPAKRRFQFWRFYQRKDIHAILEDDSLDR